MQKRKNHIHTKKHSFIHKNLHSKISPAPAVKIDIFYDGRGSITASSAAVGAIEPRLMSSSIINPPPRVGFSLTIVVKREL